MSLRLRKGGACREISEKLSSLILSDSSEKIAFKSGFDAKRCGFSIWDNSTVDVSDAPPVDDTVDRAVDACIWVEEAGFYNEAQNGEGKRDHVSMVLRWESCSLVLLRVQYTMAGAAHCKHTCLRLVLGMRRVASGELLRLSK